MRYAKNQGDSVNGVMNALLRETLKMSEEGWKWISEEKVDA